ncbi:FG-GAP repeat domain-containing protein [Paraliomyxa miuraensis]|uniref:FG-GAP repeat domain-containing protein n=1 Tax=Paraliomyxa miuraensis TaxID=376150 RepID=UPI00224F89C2|nr:VCBS repeat-containing protein [Paraliomyxa miuraensis]MCX4247071.1 VCBS repeat-containing protein [Paraliomyxa miuraensis]
MSLASARPDLLFLLSALALLAACPGDDTRPGADTDTGIITASGPTGTDGSTSVGETEAVDETGTTTTGGPACDDTCEGVCVGDVCCAADKACDAVCCAEQEVCSFQQCVVPGAECVDASECPDGNYCEYSLGEPGQGGGMGMCQGGASLATGKCLPEPPECPPGVEPTEGGEIDCLPQCEVIPQTSFAPVLKYHWDLGNSMMAPIVVQLDDDNCDMVVDERDLPEIVFSTFAGSDYNNNGTLRAISIVDGMIVEKWFVNPGTDQVHPGRSIAGGNIDGVAGNEIVTCTNTGRVRAFDANGIERWVSEYAGGCFMPSIADLDQDGTAEVIELGGIIDGVTGMTEATYPTQFAVVTSDVDGDGRLEVVGPRYVFEADGTPVADVGLSGHHAAVADFDGDGGAEIAVINNGNHTLYLWRVNPGMPGGAEIIRQNININGALGECSGGTGGGPPTIADFNGDGTPDVGVAAGVGYAVFDGAALMNPAVADADTLLWITPAQDCSSRRTGSSVFDFDGNGSAEVVYGDEQYLRIYDGATGAVVLQECNTTGTLEEYPLVADVDNDGHADIVVISNDYHGILCPDDGSQQRGLRVFGDDQWVRTRRVWNQHAYHVTNVEEDGTIPTAEVANWSVAGLNNFRQNVQPEGEFSAPDLVATVIGICSPDEFGAIARVRNLGRAAVPQGVAVGFYEGDPSAGGVLLGTELTTKILYPAEAEDVTLLLPEASEDLRLGNTELWVVVDDGMPPHPWVECRPDNNRAHGPIACNVAG